MGVIIPNLLDWPGSLVVLDIKRENFENSIGFMREEAQVTGSRFLAGWRRREAAHCIVLTIKVVQLNAAKGCEPGCMHLAIDDEQLCSLARDLTRAAEHRGLNVWSSSLAKAGPIGRFVDKIINPGARKRGTSRGTPLRLPSPRAFASQPVEDSVLSV